MVLGIATPGLSGTGWHQVVCDISVVTRDLWDPLPSSSVLTSGWAPKLGLILLLKAELVELAGCRLRSFAASLCWKSFSSWEEFSEPINWYLSVSHVCGGVNKSQQLSFVVAPSAIPPQIIQENLKKLWKGCEKGDTTLQKAGEGRKGIWCSTGAAVTCGRQLQQAWHSVLGSEMGLSGFMRKLVVLEERLHPLKC